MAGTGSGKPASSVNKVLLVVAVVLGILAAGFLIAMCVYIDKYNKLADTNGLESSSADAVGNTDPEQLEKSEKLKHPNKCNKLADTDDSESPSADEKTDPEQLEKSAKLYSDLSAEQISSIMGYMKSDSGLDVVSSDTADLNSNYVYTIAPVLPAKEAVLDYLYNNGPQPQSKAKVTLFMGGTNPKSIKEVLVYPIDSPTTMEEYVNPGGNIPTWQSRPICAKVEAAILDNVIKDTLAPVTPMLKANHDMWYDSTCSDDQCLMYVSVPREVPGSADRNIYIFFQISPSGNDDYYLYPVPLVVVYYTPGNCDTYELRRVYYDGVEYDTVDNLVQAYNDGDVREMEPNSHKKYANSFGSPKRRGKDVNPEDLPPPSVSNAAKRFTVDGHHVTWLGFEFDFNFKAISSMQMYNVRFNGESILYQLGLQDVYVYYTGGNPFGDMRSYLDVGWSIGARSSPLTPGHDCPEGAVYLDSDVFADGFDELINIKNALCIFEYRNHVPLRRHYSVGFVDYASFRFNMNMPDVVLVVRQILTVWNYDYILDIEFHQSGVIKTQIHPTGYVQVASTRPGYGNQFGYDILPDPGITALFHNHIFVFKADLDIGEQKSNRFMTMDMKSLTRQHPFNDTLQENYMVLEENLKSTELDAIIKYDFNQPKQFIIYNEYEKNERNNQSRGYRIQSSSFANTVLPDDTLLFNTPSWVKHQISVTKQKDTEDSTLSYFSQGGVFDPTISLAQFQEDNENIVDEDLVSWITLGVNHVPTAEDVPVTTTASKELSFYLVPHNFYKEDPSIASRDAHVQYP